ncbi:MAG: hypothetical protein IKW07_05080 [Clostridia bacterium]|nr:hypothetical protein [Clostridia bacterium]
MKKAVKITNWIFVIGVIVFVLIFIVAKVQAHQSETIQLPESFRSPKTELLLSLFLWSVAYAFARMVLYIKS